MSGTATLYSITCYKFTIVCSEERTVGTLQFHLFTKLQDARGKKWMSIATEPPQNIIRGTIIMFEAWFELNLIRIEQRAFGEVHSMLNSSATDPTILEKSHLTTESSRRKSCTESLTTMITVTGRN